MTPIVILALALFGCVLSVATLTCVPAHLENTQDGKLFGVIPWGVISLVGYLLIVVASQYSVGVTYALIGITALTTVWLVVKAVKIRLTCPICPMIWIVNAVLVVTMVYHFII